MISISAALKKAKLQLSDSFEAEILLAYLLQKNRAYLFTYPDEPLSENQINTYQEYIQKRSNGMPIAYLTKTREFWSLPLTVNEHTLIPRHETERLVEITLESLPNLEQGQILDLGTGSGAVALALAKEKPHWKITACDKEVEALKIAQFNAQQLGLTNIEFYHSDWFHSLPKRHYHAIVSNPPYIAEHSPYLHQGDLRYEPQSALISSQNGLADLYTIIQNSYRFLYAHGLLLLEHGYDQKIPLRAMLNKSGYQNVQCWQDLQGHDRVSGGWKREGQDDRTIIEST